MKASAFALLSMCAFSGFGIEVAALPTSEFWDVEATERMSERGDTAYSPRGPRGGAFGRRRRTPPRRGSANSDDTRAKISKVKHNFRNLAFAKGGGILIKYSHLF